MLCPKLAPLYGRHATLRLKGEADLASDVLIISDDHRDVMSFGCSDSCENGITGEKELAKSPFSEHLGFQSNAPEIAKCQMHGRKCGTR